MKLRDRVRQLAVLCSLVSASALAGCGGGGESSSVDSSSTSASSSAPVPAPTPPPPTASSDSSGGDSSSGPAGMTPPASSGEGMPNSGMANSSGMNSGMGGMGGMGMGMGSIPPEPTDPSAGYASMGGMAPPSMGGSPDMSAMMGMSSPGMGMGGMYGGQKPPVDPAPGEDEDYMTKAKYAFAIGKESVAEQYFYAHLLAHEDQAPELLKEVRWSPGARKPTTTVRFAVGVDLKAPTGIEDVRPIGRSQMAGNTGGAGGSAMPSGYGMASGMGQAGAQGAKAEKSFGDLTGKFGEELVTAFETAWDNGDFGTAFKNVETIVPVKAAPTNNPYGMGMGMSGMDPSAMGNPMMGYGSGGMSGASAAGAATTDAAARMKAVSGTAIVPGLLYVGTGSAAELEEKAQQEGIDYLFLFEVAVKQARGLVHNDTRLRLVSTKDGSAVGATSTLNNLKVDRAMATKSDSDDLAKQLGTLFRKVETLKLTDLPKLEPVHAQARIKGLIEKKPDNVLQTLMEIRLFHSMGLLDEEERNAAYQLAIGGAGVAFAAGTVEDRQTVLDPLMPAYK